MILGVLYFPIAVRNSPVKACRNSINPLKDLLLHVEHHTGKIYIGISSAMSLGIMGAQIRDPF